MKRTLLLLRFALRRERWILPIWTLGIVGLLAASGAAVAREFGDEQERAALAAVAVGNPAFLFLRGLPDGADVGALVFFQTFTFLAVLAALMNTFLMVRHTRADEERGRTELLAAAPVRRSAGLAMTLAVAVAADAVVAVASAADGIALGWAPIAAITVGAALGAVGVAFAGIAALVAQAMPSPRGANGVAAALVGVAYVVRGIGDALDTATDLTHARPSWVSLLSPIGWGQASAPFSAADPRPLLGLLALGAVTSIVALVIRSRRDLGSSLLPERGGAVGWPRSGVRALAARLQAGTLLGWAIGAAVLGVLAGALTPLVAEAVAANDDLADLIARLSPGLRTDTATVFAVALLGIAGTLATAGGVQAILRLRVEEAEGRAELLLASPVSRIAWLGRQLAVAVGSMVVIAVTAGLTAGLGFVAAGDGWDRVPESLAAVAVHLPAGTVFVALTLAGFALLPRATAAIGWGLLAIGLVLGQFGELFGLPGWLQDVSPFHHVPAVPIETVEPTQLLLPLAVAVGVAAAGILVMRRRDVTG